MNTLTSRLIAIVVCAFFVAFHASAQTRTGKFGVGIGGAAYIIQGDQSKSDPGFGGGLSLSYSATEYLGLRASAVYGQVTGTTPTGVGTTTVNFTTDMMSLNGYLSLDMMPHSALNLFLMGGGGLTLIDAKSTTSRLGVGSESVDIHYLAGGGFDYFISEFWSFTISGEYILTNLDTYDMVNIKGNTDSFVRVNMQLRYYFFDQDFITKLLEAMRGRK